MVELCLEKLRVFGRGLYLGITVRRQAVFPLDYRHYIFILIFLWKKGKFLDRKYSLQTETLDGDFSKRGTQDNRG